MIGVDVDERAGTSERSHDERRQPERTFGVRRAERAVRAVSVTVRQFSLITCNDNDNNNHDRHDDIYSAVFMTEIIARVHSVHLVNVEQHQGFIQDFTSGGVSKNQGVPPLPLHPISLPSP